MTHGLEGTATDRLARAQCATLYVEYLNGLQRLTCAAPPNAITIAMPGEQAAFSLTFVGTDEQPHSVTVRGPQIAVIPANRALSIEGQPSGELVVVMLDQDYFDRCGREALGGAAPRLTECCAVIDPLLREIGSELRDDFRTGRLPGDARLENLADAIAAHLATCHGAGPTARTGGLAPHKISRVIEFIDEHLGEPILVDRIAATVHLSPFHFARMFRRAMGQSPHVFITQHRMERAKNLLSHSDIPLAELASFIGFQTQAHFTEVFHKYTGTTPRVFRRQCEIQRAQACAGAQSPSAQPSDAHELAADASSDVLGVTTDGRLRWLNAAYVAGQQPHR
jgi:AraC family transcriptional regulator